MAKVKPSYKPLDLNGSSQHHHLKNQPGEKGDSDHQDTDTSAADDLKHAVAGTNSDTGIADALRGAVDEAQADTEEDKA